MYAYPHQVRHAFVCEADVLLITPHLHVHIRRSFMSGRYPIRTGAHSSPRTLALRATASLP